NQQQQEQARERQKAAEKAQRQEQHREEQAELDRTAQERARREQQQQQQWVAQYRQQRDQQIQLERQRRELLERQNRINRLRFQERYLERVREDQLRLQSWRYAYSPPIYRYYRGGHYCEANQYAADLLRQAVSYGYEEGIRAGRSDRDDRWGFGYRDSYAYQDATFGYTGYYVSLDTYRYYFREGFRRGYEDGYYGRWHYGTTSGAGFSLLGNVLNVILNLQRL